MTRESIVLITGLDPKPEISQRLALLLQAQGHRVRTLIGVMPVLADLYSNPPALILLPARMPDISGFELCRSFRKYEQTRQVPLLIVTSTPLQQEEAFKAGASDVIPCPFRRAEALARIRTHLELASLKRARPNGGWRSENPGSADENNSGWIRLAMQAGRIYAFEWDRKTDRVRRSGGCARVIGIEPNENVTLARALEKVHSDDRYRIQQILSILSPAYDMYDMQVRVQRSDGKFTHLLLNGRGLFDHEGRLTRVVGIAADITEQVAVQHELEDTQKELRELMHKLPVPVALANERGKIDYVNCRFTEVLGYESQDLIPPEAWLNGAPLPADAPQGFEIVAKDGAKHSVEVFGASLGKRKLILVNDVTERRHVDASLEESEARFRIMANAAPVMLWVSGKDKLCTFFNKAWLSFTGRTIDQELGDGWAAAVHPDDLDRCFDTYASAFDNREDFQMEYRLRRADGEYRWILDSGTPRFAPDRSFAGYIGSAIDVTDLKRIQQEMLAAHRLQSLGVLAGGVAHDFNNLLGCILAHAYISISELEGNSPAREGLESIEAVAIRAAQIARQLMTFIGDEQDDLEPVNLAHLVQEMAQLLRVCIPSRTGLHIDLPPSLVVSRANAPQLRQVVMNLIVNAGEAIGEPGGVITVTGKCGHGAYVPVPASDSSALYAEDASLYSGALQGGYVSLEISDTGSGMTDEVRRRMFDPFFSTKVAGRGLGLAAVREIVRSHGGVIEVASIPGQGTTVQVMLPSEIEPPHLPAPAEGHQTSLRQGSVLLVENEAPLRVSLARMLIRKGFSVIEAADGDLAMEIVRDRNQDIAVALLNLTLPGKPGPEVFAELQRIRPRVKVIFTSAEGRERIAAPLRALDSRMFFRKPYHLGELVTAVRQAFPAKARHLVSASAT